MLIQDYWSKYHDKDYINKYRNKDFSYSVMKGGHYGYKSMWNYAKNNVPKDKRMKFMTTHLNQTEREIKRRLYEIKSHWYVGDDKMPYARRPNKYNRKRNDNYYRYEK
jgi:hypothetical protein